MSKKYELRDREKFRKIIVEELKDKAFSCKPYHNNLYTLDEEGLRGISRVCIGILNNHLNEFIKKREKVII